jgi:hypothetical protein
VEYLRQIRTGDELMALREFLLGELEAGRITLRQFRARIRKACREFYQLQLTQQQATTTEAHL